VKKDAIFSLCRTYRFALWRIWDEARPYAMFIGLNPSTADEKEDDPTIKRCVHYAKSWGYGGICMANLFALRATNPGDLYTSSEPIGKDNDKWLLSLSKDAGIAVAAWGNDGMHLGRSKAVLGLIKNLHCLNLNKTGEPAHPLYLKKTLVPVPIGV
jgi:hypothetical protein